VGFEPNISTGERPQTYALDGAATGTGQKYLEGLNLSMKRKLILIQFSLLKVSYGIKKNYRITSVKVHRDKIVSLI